VRKLLFVVLTIVILWMIWAPLGRTLDWRDPDAALDHVETITIDSVCERNIVGIQPYMFPEDYMSEGHFYEKLKIYFDAAQQAGYFHTNTVVLLPEYLGTWLVISGEKKSISETSHINSAMTLMVMSNMSRVAQTYFMNQGEEDALAASLFRMKAREMARIYAEVFKELAEHYNVTISAGSIILPGPFVGNNKISVDTSKPLYNASFVFHSNGDIDTQVIKKSYPISSELPFVRPYPITDLPVFDLPIGKTAILVCADSWYPQAYDHLSTLGTEVVLVNSYAPGDNTMETAWKGYDGRDMPSDVDRQDIGTIRESEAWIKYALPGRLRQTQVSIGANVFLRGKLWDLGSDGQPFFIYNGELIKIGKSERAGIWNMCF
jgi:predicted amidohydrolase